MAPKGARINPYKATKLNNCMANAGKRPAIVAIVVKIYQDFENDIYRSLIQGYKKIGKYKKLVLVYPNKSVYPYPKRIVHGFRKFCIQKSLDFEVIDGIYEDTILKNGDLFITIVEDDLVSLINRIRENKFTIGKDIGVLSYNDTPLKNLLGISVISTDFKIMGETAARMIMEKKEGRSKTFLILLMGHLCNLRPCHGPIAELSNLDYHKTCRSIDQYLSQATYLPTCPKNPE